MTPARLAPSLPATALAGRDLHPQDIAGFAQRTHNEVFGTSCPEGRLQNDPHLEAKFSHREHASTNLGVKSTFPRFRAYQSLSNQMLSGWEAYVPQPSTAR